LGALARGKQALDVQQLLVRGTQVVDVEEEPLAHGIQLHVLDVPYGEGGV